MRRLAALALLLALARAESTIPFEAQVFLSPRRAHSLDAKPTADHKLQFALAKGSRVVAQGVLPQLPAEVQVLDSRPAAILFERYGELGKGISLALLDSDGKLRWQLPLKALFSEAVIKTFPTSMTSIWWHRAWWVDERRQKVVLVARGGLIREAALADGRVTEAEREVVLTGFPRPAALELAAEYELKGALPLAEPLLADAGQPLAIRLRAAICIQAAGGARAPKELFAQAVDPERSAAERRFALMQAARCLGKDSLDLLDAAALRRDTARDALKAMAELGAAGAGAVASVIANSETGPAEREFAVGVLAGLPPEAIAQALGAELEGADAQVAGALLRAGIRARIPDLHYVLQPQEEAILRALNRDTAPVDWLADHFTKLPSTEAVRPLLDALGRHAGNPRLKSRLINALRACTGLDFGNDPKAWRKALR
jgi:hypothetical protein